jgi:hypothetical protein
MAIAEGMHVWKTGAWISDFSKKKQGKHGNMQALVSDSFIILATSTPYKFVFLNTKHCIYLDNSPFVACILISAASALIIVINEV